MGHQKAEKIYHLSQAEYQHGSFALESVQIDHTPIDVQVVDEENRLVTKRPFITVAIDCHTRCVLGYYITYEDPSRLSIGMTLWNCVHSKKETLKKVRTQFPELDSALLNVIETSEWAEVKGLPFTLHMDNGADFRSKDIELMGLAYRMHLQYRAVGKPQHGAYVERLLGTFNNRLHSIPGTTFSNIKERDEYNSEKNAIYTIDELEARVITEIVQYHEEIHSELKTTPLAKWKQSFSINNKERAINLNLDHVNDDRFKYDILPSKFGTIQKKGVQRFGLHYSNPAIAKWVGAKDPINPKKSKHYRIRHDARNIKTIYLYDEISKNYIELQVIDRYIQQYFRDKPISLWEWNAIKNNQILIGKKNINPERKCQVIKLQQKMDEQAASKTKSARQRISRRKNQQSSLDQFASSSSNSIPAKEEKKPIDPSVFNIPKPKTTQTIQIPPRSVNPFSGITKAKAKKMAENK